MTSLFTNPWGYAVEAMAADAVDFSKEKGIPGKHVNAITHASDGEDADDPEKGDANR